MSCFLCLEKSIWFERNEKTIAFFSGAGRKKNYQRGWIGLVFYYTLLFNYTIKASTCCFRRLMLWLCFSNEKLLMNWHLAVSNEVHTPAWWLLWKNKTFQKTPILICGCINYIVVHGFFFQEEKGLATGQQKVNPMSRTSPTPSIFYFSWKISQTRYKLENTLRTLAFWTHVGVVNTHKEMLHAKSDHW